ncbi:glycerophosphodiester phosphodiesterase [Candidatus Saccharibacteria bacterium]|nr:glycerophosphodiester phosphodiesterase [Candidatus Saccharibacteria bacterium]MBH2007228.1 glycerophosphodiester phosphodiesterase [Candidatus Saccharibacteria bacterium]
MLVIGHRGAKGNGLTNTLDAMKYALTQGADGLEFDIRLTSDGVPVVIHDDTLLLTRGINRSVRTLTLRELNDLSSDKPIPTLTQVLDEFWGKTYLNIELKSRGSGEAVIGLLVSRYITHEDDWQNCLVSSFKVRELRDARQRAPHARLALLHNRNPFTFLMYQRSLRFAGLGFHRLYASLLALAIAKRLGIFTYAYTVNRPGGAQQLREKQLDAVVTDYPRRIIDALKA